MNRGGKGGKKGGVVVGLRIKQGKIRLSKMGGGWSHPGGGGEFLFGGVIHERYSGREET